MNPSGQTRGGWRAAPHEGGVANAEAAESESFRLLNDGDLRVAVARTQRLDLLRGGSDIDRSMIATIVSELGSNIVKYAGRGALRLERLERDGFIDIDIWAEDTGPGIADIDLALQEHYSTGGTLGLGLSGVQRMADEFWIRSAADTGTTVFARKRIRGKAVRPKPAMGPPARAGAPATPAIAVPITAVPITAAPAVAPVATAGLPHPPAVLANPRWDAHASVRPFPGQARGGDAALITECDGGLLLAIVDATGHGPAAQAVAEQSLALIEREASRDLARLMETLHKTLLGGVGAAAGLMFIDPAAARFRYMGIGNTRAARLGRRSWWGVSRDGLLGSRLPTLFPQEESLDAGDLLMLWTDGIAEFEGARLAESISFRGAADITRRVLTALAKPHDDAGCLVFKWPA
jgi:anti-sigma regulatory factor (Ser/Thr protein kinase)